MEKIGLTKQLKSYYYEEKSYYDKDWSAYDR